MKNNPLYYSISNIKGVGPKRAEVFYKKGINSIKDLLYFIPVGYEDRSHLLSICDLKAEQPALVKGKVCWFGEEKLFRSGKKIFKIIIKEGQKNLELAWFNINKQQFSTYAKPGLELIVYGAVRQRGDRLQMYHPDVSLFHKDMENQGFVSLYPYLEGISNKILRSVIQKAMDQYLEELVDPLPAGLLKQAGLPGLRETIRFLHFPGTDTDCGLLNRGETIYHKRLLFDRFFNLMLGIFHGKQLKSNVSIPPMTISEDMIEKMCGFFPFELTCDQMQCIRDIAADLAGGRSMNRLVMGDVGTGKTLIAAAAAYITVNNGRQAALMAPTQILAEQHTAYFQALPYEMGFRPVLITGSMKKSAREEMLASVKRGDFNIVIGTHSLIQNRLDFHDLGLAVIDEQHRFGVRQRADLIAKGKDIHVLTMSATPIPRTIALLLYGDMDISIIKEYPGTHLPVTTEIVARSEKRRIFETLKNELLKGRHAYVICPLVEQSDISPMKSVVEMAEGLRKLLSPQFRIEYIHGQLEPDKKDKIINEFKNGEIDVLVGTTVIEVGIHAPNASLMIIEHPERLGLSQLHQLRGRIGRDGKGGTCILVAPEKASEKTLKRLRVMSGCNDGFEISEKDLEYRGHGEITGTRQSGFQELEISEILNNYDLLKKARDLAEKIISTDPGLELPENRNLKSLIQDITELTL